MTNELSVHTSCPGAVLVVDDDETLCQFACETLAGENVPTVSANNVGDAIEMLNTKKVAVVILDWSLRGMGDTSGSEVLSYSKKNFPMTPVVVMSGLQFDWRTDATLKEADGCLPKPFSATLLVGTIRQWLKRLEQTPKVFLPQNENEISTLDHFKSVYIRHVVNLLHNNISLAASKLGVHRQTIAAALGKPE